MKRVTVEDDRDAGSASTGAAGNAFKLDRAVASLYEDLRLTPLLHTLLAQSRLLAGGVAGSISVVDPRSGTYTKLAERGVTCRLGQRFPLEEGATGQAFSRRRPVVIDDYSALAAGHLPPGHAASRGSATAVPIWWRGDLIGVNVTFAGRRREYTTAEIDQLEVLTQTAAGAIVTAGAGEPSLGRLIRDQMEPFRDHPTGRRTLLTEVGPVGPVPPPVAEAAVGLVRSVQKHTAGGRAGAPVHVAILYRAGGIRVLVQAEDGRSERCLAGDAGPEREVGSRRLLTLTGGAADVQHVAGWGTLLRADISYQPSVEASASASAEAPCPLTSREAEVLALVARGWGDREIARALAVSPRTVEKHVGAALRKTGTTSRTGAAMRGVERGWLVL